MFKNFLLFLSNIFTPFRVIFLGKLRSLEGYGGFLVQSGYQGGLHLGCLFRKEENIYRIQEDMGSICRILFCPELGTTIL